MRASTTRTLPKVGAVVTVFQEGSKRGSSKLGVIESFITGKDQRRKGSKCESDHKSENRPHKQTCSQQKSA